MGVSVAAGVSFTVKSVAEAIFYAKKRRAKNEYQTWPTSINKHRAYPESETAVVLSRLQAAIGSYN
jgi:hypothetical protein